MDPQLADFAQECFDTQGPGVIRVGIPLIAPTSLPDPFSTSMTYETAEDLRREPAPGETAMMPTKQVPAPASSEQVRLRTTRPRWLLGSGVCGRSCESG